MKGIFFVDRTSPARSVTFISTIVVLVSAIALTVDSNVFAASWETSAMRTPGGGLVRTGMTRQEVLKELGSPQHTRGTTRNAAASGKSGKKGGSLTYRADDGMYTITFSGERVSKIVVTPNRD
jgi:hypothetical protein